MKTFTDPENITFRYSRDPVTGDVAVVCWHPPFGWFGIVFKPRGERTYIQNDAAIGIVRDWKYVPRSAAIKARSDVANVRLVADMVVGKSPMWDKFAGYRKKYPNSWDDEPLAAVRAFLEWVDDPNSHDVGGPDRGSPKRPSRWEIEHGEDARKIEHERAGRENQT